MEFERVGEMIVQYFLLFCPEGKSHLSVLYELFNKHNAYILTLYTMPAPESGLACRIWFRVGLPVLIHK
jgi:hypothetical protein